MSDYKLVPFEPTPEMVSAAEDAHMPFGDMDMALRMAILAAPAVQGEHIAEAGKMVMVPAEVVRFLTGEGELEGMAFGEHPKRRPFWWRKHLHSLAAAPQAAPAVQVGPVVWSGWGCQYPGKMPRLYGDRRIAELNCDRENGDQLLHFTAAPQPAELIDGTATAESLASGEEEPVVALVHQNASGQVALRDYHSGDAWDMSRHVGSALVERTVFPRPQWVTRGDV